MAACPFCASKHTNDVKEPQTHIVTFVRSCTGWHLEQYAQQVNGFIDTKIDHFPETLVQRCKYDKRKHVATDEHPYPKGLERGAESDKKYRRRFLRRLHQDIPPDRARDGNTTFPRQWRSAHA
jgi:hypothetical protein